MGDRVRLAGGLAGLVALAAGVMLLARPNVSVSEAKTPSAGVVDSAIPREEALRRFRSGLAPIDSLEGGEASLEALVEAFVLAVETKDTSTFRRLSLSLREFAWLYYETNPQSQPPYDLDPALFWFMLERNNRGGLIKLLEERGGKPVGYLRSRCEGSPSRQGENTVYGPCLIVRRGVRGDTVEERLFGPIIQRQGKWKFVSYSNKLD